MIIAVDFDGTLEINGKPNTMLISALRRRQQQGCAVILWTCRHGKSLEEAVRFCLQHGLRFNAVNQNLPQIASRFGYDPRKIFADIYIDDKAAKP